MVYGVKFMVNARMFADSEAIQNKIKENTLILETMNNKFIV